MKRRVLILCTGNSARSQMAQGLINARRGERWQAFSAGTQPAARVNPFALSALHKAGIATEALTPKSVESFRDQAFDLVITVCDDAAENCPAWLGTGRRVHISLADPAKATGSDDEIAQIFQQTLDDIERRVLPMLDG
jgi:arsenate reductase